MACRCLIDQDLSEECLLAFKRLVHYLRHDAVDHHDKGWVPYHLAKDCVDLPWDETSARMHSAFDTKGRVEWSIIGQVSATCGHTYETDRPLPPVGHEQLVAYHATPASNIMAILANGLSPMGREFVHLLPDADCHHEGNLAMSRFDSCNHFVIAIDLSRVPAWWSTNGYILSRSVPREALMFAYQCVVHGDSMEVEDHEVVVNGGYFYDDTIGGGLSNFPRTTVWTFDGPVGDLPTFHWSSHSCVNIPSPDQIEHSIREWVGDTCPNRHCCCIHCSSCESSY